jgi:hypothetical protein
MSTAAAGSDGQSPTVKRSRLLTTAGLDDDGATSTTTTNDDDGDACAAMPRSAGRGAAGAREASVTRPRGLIHSIITRARGREATSSVDAASTAVRDAVSLGATLAGLTETRAIGTFGTPTSCVQNPDSASDIVAVGCGGGVVQVINMSVSDEAPGGLVNIRCSSDDSMVFDVAWLSLSQMIVGDSSGSMLVIDVGHECAKSYVGHKRSIKSISVAPGSQHVFASSDRDGNVNIWDVRHAPRRAVCYCGDHRGCAYAVPGMTLVQAHGAPRGQVTAHSVTSTSFLGGEKTLATGGTDGTVRIWDLRKTYTTACKTPTPALIVPPPRDAFGSAITSVSADDSGATVLASHLNGCVVVHRGLARGSPDDATLTCASDYRGYHDRGFDIAE